MKSHYHKDTDEVEAYNQQAIKLQAVDTSNNSQLTNS